MKGLGWAPGGQVHWRQRGREGTSLNESVMIKSFALPWAPPAFGSLAEMLPPIRYLPFLSASQPTATGRNTELG